MKSGTLQGPTRRATAATADAVAEDAAQELVATSAHVLVLASTDRQGMTEAAVLDLDTGRSHDLMGASRLDASDPLRLRSPRPLTATKQGTTLATLSGIPQFAQLQDDGFQPLRTAQGEPTDSYFAGFVAEGRYVLYATGKPVGFVLYDTQSRAAVWRVEHADDDAAAQGAPLRFDAVVGAGGAFAVQLGARSWAGWAGDDVLMHELAAGADLPVFDPEGARIAYAVRDAARMRSTLEWMELEDGERHVLSAELPFAAPRFFLPGPAGVVASILRPIGPEAWDLRTFSLAGEGPGSALHDPAGPGVNAWTSALDRSSLLVAFDAQDGVVKLAALDPRAAHAPTPLGAYGHVSALWPLGPSGFSFFSDPGTLDALFSVHAIVPGAQGSPLQVSVIDSNLRSPASCTPNPAGAASAASFVLGTLYEDTVPDDLYVYGNDLRRQLFVVDVAHGTPTTVATLGDGTTFVSCPVWSPNQRGFAYSSSTPTDSRIYLVRRTPSGLSEPELVYESELGVQVIAARF